MAPRFKKNMYKVWKKDEGSEALICFVNSYESRNFIFKFRDKLVENIINNTGLEVLKKEFTEHDSLFLLFDKKDIESARPIFEKDYPKHPGLLAWFFKTKNYKKYMELFKAVSEGYYYLEKLAKFELSTSHDHLCIDICNKIYSEKELANEIQKVASDLEIEMLENPKNLPNKSSVICSNCTFDILSDGEEKRSHIQIITWKKGVDDSHKHFYIPLFGK